MAHAKRAGCYIHCIFGLNLHSTLGTWSWGVVICDESHTMRTTKRKESVLCNVAAAVVRRATRAVLMSGTPSLTRPFDIFAQVCGRSRVGRRVCG